jgi:hypothetical protein
MWEKIRPRVRGVYNALTNSDIPIHRQENCQPFFIVGSGRCGTTLLRRILQASPEVHIPPENWGLGYVIYHFRRNRWHLQWEQVAEMTIAAFQHRTHDWFRAISNPGNLIEEVTDWPPSKRSLYRLLDRLYRYHGEEAGAEFRRWGDKTPVNINLLDPLLQCFPDAKFVNLVRDGADVVYSWSRHEKHDGNVIRPAHRWKEAVAQGRQFALQHPDAILHVRYEQLVRSPKTTVNSVCRFVGLPYDNALLSRTDHFDEIEKAQSIVYFQNAFESITDENIGKGRRGLTDSQKRQIAPIINDLLSQLGYEPVER